VDAAERAISAAGHVIVDMADFPAADQAPAELCAARVRGCDVYVGVLGTRYGSPVRDRPPFTNPDALGHLVERSLWNLAGTRRRIGSGIEREQVPAEPQPVRASKFVNPPPTAAPASFQDRQAETGQLARYVTDPGIAMVTVTGRGGIGKTAMVCRLLKGLEAGRIPDADGEPAAITVGGIVYLSGNGLHKVEYPTLVADLLKLLPAEKARRLQRIYQDPHHSAAETMLAVLEAFPAGEPVVVLLDNLESVMDAERQALADQALHQALAAVLTGPAHAVTVLATTRVTPAALLKIEPGRQRRLLLDQGLGSPDAQAVLQALDGDGRLGLRDAPDELLDGLRQHTRGFPRALEAVKAILEEDATLSPQDLLDRTRHLPEDQVVQVLVGEAYQLLDAPAQQVMQALSVYPAPVPAVGIDFLLQPVNPTTDAVLILARLVDRQLARFQDRHYYLHPVDREYARSQLPAGGPGDSPAAFTLRSLQARAADYYAQTRTPPEAWRTLDDVRPQLAEFELRCDTGDYDTAAAVLAEIDDYLRVWGHYRMLVDRHGRIHGRITDPTLNAGHLRNLGACHAHLGEYRQAIGLYTQALAIAREISNRPAEGAALDGLAACHASLGEYRQAIDLYTQALAIAQDAGDRRGEGTALGNVGNCHAYLGEYRQAIDLHNQALTIARDTGDRQGEGTALVNLGNCHACQGEYDLALDLHNQALTIASDTGDRRAAGAVLVNLGNCYYRLGDYPRAIDHDTQALTIARDIGDRYAEALALEYLGRAWLASGEADRAVELLEQAMKIADTTGDIEPAVEARSWLARAHLQLGDPAAALIRTTERRELPYPAEEPMLRLLEGLALLDLHRLEESAPAFSAALTAADALLALADSNVAALQAHALAVSGLAAATGNPAQAAEAREAFARANDVTRAKGVVEGTSRLLEQIACHDRSGVLAGIRAAQDP
jgi:tetratricopeptide (TPR) repeat protein